VAARRARADTLGAGIVIDPARPDYGNTPAALGRPTSPYAATSGGTPAISIVTPFFNTGAVFHETARSVMAQSCQSWEWLIVNDASFATDSLAVLDYYRTSDARIRIIDLTDNVGPSAARNRGAREARAPYLLFLDSDDLLEPIAAEAWWWFLESYPEFAFVKGFSVGFGAMEYLAASGFHEESAFLERNRVDITALVRADVFHAAGGFPEGNREGLEDWEFWLRCARAGHWGGTVPQYLSWYRRRGDEAARWPNWQGDGGSTSLRARLRKEFNGLYSNPATFPRPRPSQQRGPGLQPRRQQHGAGLEPPQRQRGPGIQPRQQQRLLLIAPWLTVGGADRFNLDLATQLTARGWNVSIATTLQGDNSWLALFTAVTPDVFVLPDIVRLSHYPQVLETQIGSRQIDTVLIANSELAYRLLPSLRPRCPGVAFVDFCHMEQEEWLDGGYPRLSIDAAEYLDRTVVLSEHLRNWMLARGREGADVFVSHNGVDVPDEEHVTRERARFRAHWVTADTPVIVFAGRLVDQKQPRVFVEAICRLWDDGAQFNAVVAGDGPWLPVVRERLEKAGGARVRVLGTVPPEMLDRVLCGSDILCLPSQWEGIALVVQEAMARGVAVVTADVGGQRELVTPDCGMLIAPANERTAIAAYAAALERLVSNPAERRRLGDNARVRVRRQFTVQQMGERMDTLLRAVTRKNGVAQPADPTLVIDAMRSAYTPYWNWVQAAAARRAEPAPSLSGRVFRALTVLEPAYRWGLRRGWSWLPSVRRRLRGRVRGLLGIER
jgi:glycosyltransferase involved in cell wall biosynthesis/GT2 family glycosyltransferase